MYGWGPSESKYGELGILGQTAVGLLAVLEAPFAAAIASVYWVGDRILDRKNAVIDQEYTLVDGEKEGEYRAYYPNGKLMEISQYRNGEKSGPSKIYYGNGDLKTDCFYLSGKLYGDYKEYYEGGQLKTEARYQDGEKLIGKKTEYHPNGIIKFECNYTYLGGYPDGPERYFDSEGNLTALCVYLAGMRLSGKEADDYLVEWEEEKLGKDPKWKEITDKLEHLTDEKYYPPIKPARTPERTEKAKKIIKVRRGAELLANAIKDAHAKKKTTLLSMLRRIAHPFAEEEMLQRRVFSRLRESRKIRRKQKSL